VSFSRRGKGGRSYSVSSVALADWNEKAELVARRSTERAGKKGKKKRRKGGRISKPWGALSSSFGGEERGEKREEERTTPPFIITEIPTASLNQSPL